MNKMQFSEGSLLKSTQMALESLQITRIDPSVCPLCPNLIKKVQKEVSQMANCNFPIGML